MVNVPSATSFRLDDLSLGFSVVLRPMIPAPRKTRRWQPHRMIQKRRPVHSLELATVLEPKLCYPYVTPPKTNLPDRSPQKESLHLHHR